MKSFDLPAGHYAAAWKVDESPLNAERITDLGCRYAASAGQEKEDLLLELCQAFHPYLMKYLTMICQNHVPTWGNKINSDTAAFLKYFLLKGVVLDRPTAQTVVSGFHLAFKGMETEEVYDVLMEQFLAAVAKYDPAYTEKVKQVVECMEDELSRYKQVRAVDLNRHVEFDSDRILRLLARRGFLTAVKGKGGKIAGRKRTGSWPPPAEFFKSGVIGFAYYIQTWFRYDLQQNESRYLPPSFAKTPSWKGEISIPLSL